MNKVSFEISGPNGPVLAIKRVLSQIAELVRFECKHDLYGYANATITILTDASHEECITWLSDSAVHVIKVTTQSGSKSRTFVNNEKTTSVSINQTWNCSPKQFVANIAAIIYRTHDATVTVEDMLKKFNSAHPTEKACWRGAEEIFEMLTGYTPDYQEE